MNHALFFRFFFVCLLLLLTGDRLGAKDKADVPGALTAPGSAVKTACLSCHATVQLDAAHRFACTVCHSGNGSATEKNAAHQSLIARPGHPQAMSVTCGKCHAQVVQSAQHSLHFTLKNKVNAVRRHFGATRDLAHAELIPVEEPPASVQALADDMLRRRCLRCHPYSRGDQYSAVTHGTGCASCHLSWKEGRMESHVFQAPRDRQCLSCHYGNYVGWDYYGRYEHDFNWEYRTPYTMETPQQYPDRPYGVEYHDLVPDIHQQRGLVCIDCHQQPGHESGRQALSCRSCHDWQPGQKPALARLQVVDRSLVLTGAANGKQHPVPMLRHPAHQQYGAKVDCQVCHGQWSFNDSPTHLLRSEELNYDSWINLAVQGSSEVERILVHNAYSSRELPLIMRDGLSGAERPGIWLQSYGLRRWEQMIIDRDADGIIKVFRPILDLHLSMMDADGNAPFDSQHGLGAGKLPYTPHTTGPAGMFYQERFKHLLDQGKDQSP
jgi:hypothetical protein